MSTSDEIEEWRKSTCMDKISCPGEDQLATALEMSSASTLDIPDLGIVIETLANYHLYLAKEMGRIYARVQWNGDRIERAKLNMIKPVHDATKVKLDALKKIFEAKVREDKWRNNA